MLVLVFYCIDNIMNLLSKVLLLLLMIIMMVVVAMVVHQLCTHLCSIF